MTNELPRYLLSLTLASSLGIVAVVLMRCPARQVFGATAAYSLWLLVPVAMLAALLPHVSSPVALAWRIDSVSALSHAFGSPSLAARPSLAIAPSTNWHILAFSVWCSGATFFAIVLALQQRAFVKSLGRLSGSRHVLRTARSGGSPVLLGVFRPKIILPVDFKSRYTPLERLLIFSHERTHLRRGDAICNGFAALIRCIFWFNPLVHLASSYFRRDQEFACDAAVLRDYPASRRAYAGAMLKTQLADLALPIGCHWHSAQGLKERIRMLQRRMPSRGRRLCGGALTAFLSLVVGCSAWIAQPQARLPKASSAFTPARSLVTGPIAVTADQINVLNAATGQPMVAEIRNGRLVVPPRIPLEVSADMVSFLRSTSGDYVNVLPHVRLADVLAASVLQGHVRVTISIPADANAPSNTTILETDKAVSVQQRDGSLVVQFEEGRLEQVSPAAILTAPLSLTPPETPHLVTPNFKDADLAQVAEAVGLATHRSFMIDPRVHAQVSLLSSVPMTPEAFYQAFVGILQAHGLTALPTDAGNGVTPARVAASAADVIWIVPSLNTR